MVIDPLYVVGGLAYGLLFMFALGIAINIVTAIATVLFYAAAPFIFVFTIVACVVTYPITLILRHYGYNAWSLFEVLKSIDYFLSGKSYVRPQKKASNESTQRENENHSEQKQSANTDETIFESSEKRLDPWAILEVPKNASKEIVREAYRKKMVRNHPDKVSHLDPALQKFANERAVLIQQAYETLIAA